jgi:hypothetical protein
MLIWGGEYEFRSAMEPINRGWRYHPTFNRWRILGDEESRDAERKLLPDADPLAADARTGHTAVWTGEEMIVWGGRGAEDEILNSAGRYHLEDAAWREISSDGSAPGSPGDVIAVWTGERMIAWNGGSRARKPVGARTVELRAYDPVQNRWQASAAGWEPQFLAGSTEPDGTLVKGGVGRLKAFWTGSVLLVVGVEDSKEKYESDPGGWVNQATVAAYLYDPALDRWQSGGSIQATVARNERGSFEAAWTGDALLVLLGNQLYQFTPPGT